MSVKAKPFAVYHSWDRNFFLTFVAICWLGVIMGFAPATMGRMAGKADYPAPLILHVHALAFISWLLVLTTQVLLVRTKHLSIHKRLGLISILLIPVMAVSAVLSEIYSQRFYLDHPPDSQAFFIIPLFYIFAFTPLAAGAVLKRGNPAMHKRLILSATTIIVGAAYARWWGNALTETFGDDFLGTIINTFTGTNLIILAALAYDWTTRRQLHRVYLFVVPAIIIGEVATSYIYHSPQWLPIARMLVGR